MKVTVTGIEDAIAELQKVEDTDEPILEGIREAMDVAADIVTSAYMMQDSTNRDFSTNISRVPNGYMLTVEGSDVGFLEFGAGIETDADELASEVPFPVFAGSWSAEHNGMFIKRGYWFYGGQKMTGIAPTKGIQLALDFLRDELKGYIVRKIDEWIGN